MICGKWENPYQPGAEMGATFRDGGFLTLVSLKILGWTVFDISFERTWVQVTLLNAWVSLSWRGEEE